MMGGICWGLLGIWKRGDVACWEYGWMVVNLGTMPEK